MQVSKPTLDFSLKKNDGNITIINNNRTMKDTQGELKVTVIHPPNNIYLYYRGIGGA